MKDRSRVIFGFILIFFGVVLMGTTFQIFYFDIGDFLRALLPIGIILLGAWLMVRRKKLDDKLRLKQKICEQEINVTFKTGDDSSSININTGVDDYAKTQSESTQEAFEKRSTQSPKIDESGKTKYDKFLGDIFIDLNKVNAQNVEVSVFIGDTEMKIHGAVLADKLNRIIISSFIGDIRIFTPKDMAVFVHCSNFIGDISALGKHSSGFGNNLEAQTASYDSATQKIYIACNSFIGDIKVIEI